MRPPWGGLQAVPYSGDSGLARGLGETLVCRHQFEPLDMPSSEEVRREVERIQRAERPCGSDVGEITCRRSPTSMDDGRRHGALER